MLLRLVRLEDSLGDDSLLLLTVVGFSATMGQAGSAAFPFMTGAIAAKAGVKVLQPMLVGLLAGMAILWLLLPRMKKPMA